MKSYYDILNVSPDAGQAEIRKAFRRMAVQYHPDKNPDPNAASVFQEINEAYEALTDPHRKALHDALLSGRFTNDPVVPPVKRHRDPAYRRPRPAGGRHVKSEREHLLDTMAEYLPLANRVVYFSFGICLLLLADVSLPERVVRDKIVDAYNVHQRFGRRNVAAWWEINTMLGTRVQVHFNQEKYFQAGDWVTVRTSPLLGIPRRVEGNEVVATISKSVYGSFAFAPIALFVSSVIGIIFRKRIDFGFNSGLICFLLLVLMGILYIFIH